MENDELVGDTAQVRRADRVDAGRPLAQLPVPLTSFVGRAAELTHLAGLVAAGRLVTVTGPGGCGKTRLAIELVNDHGDQHQPIALTLLGFVELAAVGRDSHVAAAVLSACGIRDDPSRSGLERLRDRWSGTSGLLVLDNCEHLMAEVADFVGYLLDVCPALRILITSRARLGITGEMILTLTGLAEPDDSFRLLLDRLQALEVGVPDGPYERAVAYDICQLADGLPLAIELAAAHARSLTLPEIRDGVAGQPSAASADPNALAQHASLAACIRWSTDLLSEDGRRALHALSIVGGRFTLPVALAVLGADSPEIGRALIRDLVDHSLVQFDAKDGRYVLLETVRAYVTRALASNDEVDRVHGRLLEWADHFARSVRDSLDRADTQTVARVFHDEAALLTAVGHCIQTGQAVDRAQEIVPNLVFAWSLQGRCSQGRDVAARVTAAAHQPSARLIWAAAFLTVYSGDVETGFELAVKAAGLAADAGDQETQGRALILVGLAQELVNPVGAEEVLKTAADLAEGEGDDWGRIEALQVLAYACLYQADHRSALIWADRAKPVVDQLGHEQLRAWDHVVRADAAAMSGDLSVAITHARRGLELATAVGEPVSAVGALKSLVRGLVHVGRADEAAQLVSDLRPFFAIHPGLGSSMGVEVSAAMAACWQNPAAGRDLVAGVRVALAERGTPVLDGPMSLLLGYCEAACGNTDAAAAAAQEAAGCGAQLSNGELICTADLVLADAQRAGPRALELAHRALTAAAALGLRPLVSDSLDVIASLEIDAGRPHLAARLHAASSRLREELGAVCSPLVRTFRPEDEVRIAASLTPEEMINATEAGRGLSLNSAVAYASRSRGPRIRPKVGWESLTPTERDVSGLAAKGLTNLEIGQQMLIGSGTVRTHLRAVFRKLGVSSRTELAALFIQRQVS